MSVKDGIHADAHGYPGGLPALAGRMRLAEQTLRNMANPNSDSHPWSLLRFEQLTAFSPDKRALQELCLDNDGLFLSTKKYRGMGFADLFPLVGKLAAELGDVSREVGEAVQDGGISKNDYQKIAGQINELLQAAAALLQAAALAAGEGVA